MVMVRATVTEFRFPLENKMGNVRIDGTGNLYGHSSFCESSF